MSDPLLKAVNLSKQFGDVKALEGLNLQVHPGETYGLLGPNGAGKSTTMKIAAGLLEPTSGTVSVVGYDPVQNPIEAKSRIGYVAENPTMYESLSQETSSNSWRHCGSWMEALPIESLGSWLLPSI